MLHWQDYASREGSKILHLAWTWSFKEWRGTGLGLVLVLFCKGTPEKETQFPCHSKWDQSFYRIGKGSFVHGDWSNISGYPQAGFGGMGAPHSIGMLQSSRCFWSKWLQRLLKSKAQQPSQAYEPWHVFQAVRAEIYNSDTTHKLRFRMKEDVILVLINIASFCLNLDMSFQ